LVDSAVKYEEAEAAENAKATVDEAPIEGYAADGTGNEREQGDARAGDKSEGKEELIADRVDPRANEGNTDDEVREGEPVCSVGKERIVGVRISEREVDTVEPGVELWGVLSQVEVSSNAGDEGELVLEREGCDAAKEETEDDDR
jgi:hypothetical protein